MNVATFTANVSYGFTDRFDVYARMGLHHARRSRQPGALCAGRPGARRHRHPRARTRASAGPATRSATFASARKYAFLSEGEGDPFSARRSRARATSRPVTPTQGAGQGSVAADLSGVVSRWVTNKVVVTGDARLQLPQEPDRPGRRARAEQLPLGRGRRHQPDAVVVDPRRNPRRQPGARQRRARWPMLVAEDGSISPRVSFVDHQTSFTGGVTWFAKNGFFIGAEMRLDTPMPERINASEDSRSRLSRLSRPHRLGAAPRAAAAAATGDARRRRRRRRAPHELSVKANCDPCTVEVGKVSTVSAVVDRSRSAASVTYAWSAPTGTFGNARRRTRRGPRRCSRARCP